MLDFCNYADNNDKDRAFWEKYQPAKDEHNDPMICRQLTIIRKGIML